jgi:ribosomal protein S27AE
MAIRDKRDEEDQGGVKDKRLLCIEGELARNTVSNAIRDGRIVRGPCERCGAARVQAHHHDYRKPREVRWLCARCHGAEHAAGNERWRAARVDSILHGVALSGARPRA